MVGHKRKEQMEDFVFIALERIKDRLSDSCLPKILMGGICIAH